VLLLNRTPYLKYTSVACAVCRTLTPFGFQAEERTLWQAPDTYALMSPFQNADKIKKPLLLIHGADDNNTGQDLEGPDFCRPCAAEQAMLARHLLPFATPHCLKSSSRTYLQGGQTATLSQSEGVPSNSWCVACAGTFPLQSERFYAALKGNGAPCRLVILPHESHGYRCAYCSACMQVVSCDTRRRDL
jgi:hypothetical protein